MEGVTRGPRVQLQPLRFIDRQLFPYLVKVTKQFSDHVDCDPRDLVLMLGLWGVGFGVWGVGWVGRWGASSTQGLPAMRNACAMASGSEQEEQGRSPPASHLTDMRLACAHQQVLLPNATSGLNAVIQSVPLGPVRCPCTTCVTRRGLETAPGCVMQMTGCPVERWLEASKQQPLDGCDGSRLDHGRAIAS